MRRRDRTAGKIGRRHLLLFYVSLIIAATGALFYFYDLKSSGMMEKEITKSVLQTLKQTDINISNRLDKAQIISESVFSSPEVMLFVGEENNKNIALQVQQQRELNSFFNGLLKGDNSMWIRLFVSGEKLCSAERVRFFPLEDVAGRTWYKKTAEERGRVYWTGAYREKYADSGEQNVISCARVLKHTYDYSDNRGILLVDISEGSLYSILSCGVQDGEKVFVVDADGRAVSCGDKAELGKRIVSEGELGCLTGTSGVTAIVRNQEKIDVVYQTVSATGWKIVAEIKRNDIVRPNVVFSGTFSIVFLISMFLIIVLGIFLFVLQTMLGLNRQLRKFAENIGKQDAGAVETIGREGGSAGLMGIENYFNAMTRKVKTLMDENYRSKIRERDAQLMALQAQINPHFLYNTLDMINWMAFSIGAQDICATINALSKYFRLSLNKGKAVVSIRDELELSKTYLSIQRTRFMGAVQFRFEIDGETEAYSIPKLTLQPIVENAVLHGIQKKADRRGEIVVRSKKAGPDITIWVRDDGVGMDRETIDRVLHAPTEEDRASYGLFNVNERLRLTYGEGYGLRIRSEVHAFTEVEVRIKAVRKE